MFEETAMLRGLKNLRSWVSWGR